MIISLLDNWIIQTSDGCQNLPCHIGLNDAFAGNNPVLIFQVINSKCHELESKSFKTVDMIIFQNSGSHLL